MDPIVLTLVLVAALLHASWNALVKSGGDPFVRLAVVNAVGGLCTLPLLFLVDPPAAASWPYLAGSVELAHKRALYLEEAARLTWRALALGRVDELAASPVADWLPGATAI